MGGKIPCVHFGWTDTPLHFWVLDETPRWLSTRGVGVLWNPVDWRLTLTAGPRVVSVVPGPTPRTVPVGPGCLEVRGTQRSSSFKITT